MISEQKITPCIWFDKNCEEAVNFYTSIFPNSRITSIQRYPGGITEGPMKGMEGKILTANFELDGFALQAFDGGPYFKINPSISFFVNFDPSRDPKATEHLNTLWEKLSEGGMALMPLQEYPFSKRYGWVQDRFGVSWQLILTDPAGEPRPSIIPSLLFVGDVYGKAEEATNFYLSVFKDSKLGTRTHYGPGQEPNREGTVMFSDFNLLDTWFVAMDGGGGHKFSFNEALSLSVECADQQEVDYFWERMSAVPEAEQCGWLKDIYGVSWQIVPKQLGEFMGDPDPEKVARVTAAFMQMKKFDVAKLQAAYDGNE